MPPTVVRISIDGKSHGLNSKLLRIPCNTVVEFVIPNRNVTMLQTGFKLMTNCPTNEEQEYKCDVMHELKFQSDTTTYERKCSFTVRVPGAFRYSVDHNGNMLANSDGKFVVEPIVKINGHELPMEAMTMQTVLTKCMGPLDEWVTRLETTAKTGYNFVHFTPVQKLGLSNSCYSVYDQLTIAPSIVPREPSNEARVEKLAEKIQCIEEKLSMLSLTDIVLNHTANDTPWLEEHPEAAYTSLNCPHLHAAIELEDAILELSKELGAIEGGQVLQTEQHLEEIMATFAKDFLPKYKLWEYFVLDVDVVEANFAKSYKTLLNFPTPEDYEGLDEVVKPGVIPKQVIECLTDKEFIQVVITRTVQATANPDNPRRSWSMDLAALMTLLRQRFLDEIPDYGAFLCWDAVKVVVETVNLSLYQRYDIDIAAALKAIEGTARFEWLEQNPPKGYGNKSIGASLPLVDPYFTRIKFKNGDVVAFANNGFIWGGNPLHDFGHHGPLGEADPSCPYFRRELVIWGDCVKLRYGKSPSESSWLWSYMQEYVEQMARVFHGFRIDNAHGTPKHVAAAMLDHARKVRPHLLVQAELFTGSEELDFEYVSDLGFNMLIREAMQAPDAKQLADLIYCHGGNVVAGLSNGLKTEMKSGSIDTIPPSMRRLPVVFFDCTHDNETPTQKRTTEDSLSNAVLVAMSSCAIGSVRGYDDLVPKNPSVVHEKRLYPVESNNLRGAHNLVSVKRYMNVLHVSMAQLNLDEIHVDYIPIDDTKGESLVVVTRSNSESGQSVVAICRPAFRRLDTPTLNLPEITLDGHFVRLGFAANMKVWQASLVNFEKDPRVINGLVAGFHVQDSFPCEFANIYPVHNTSLNNAPITKVQLDGKVFCPGSAIVMQCSAFDRKLATEKGHAEPLAKYSHPTVNPAGIPLAVRPGDSTTEENGKSATNGSDNTKMNNSVESASNDDAVESEVVSSVGSALHDLVPTESGTQSDPIGTTVNAAAEVIPQVLNPNIEVDAKAALQRLTLSEMNTLMFCCEVEERDRTSGKDGNYVVPGTGPLYYAGIAGAFAQLRRIAEANDMGNPLLDNIRQGNWLLEHIANRLPKDNENFVTISNWITSTFGILNGVASGVRPLLVFRLVSYIWQVICDSVYSRMSLFVQKGPTLVKKLALTSITLFSHVPSAPLLRLDDNRLASMFSSGKIPKASLAAGLTHFATNFMRNWGRDTFIALRGLLLVPGRFDDARDVILSYAAVVRHGLVPNLMDGGSRPRFNARDATWFFLQALQDYCEMLPRKLNPDGSEDYASRYEIMNTSVFRLFPFDRLEKHNSWVNNGREPAVYQPLHQIVFEILQKHYCGIRFREWNAGHKLDDCMTDEGFNVEIQFDPTCGILFGGNQSNCGTWMDKMGSVPGVNRGKPATPRDGAPIEITGLLKSTLRWVCLVHDRYSEAFPYTAVESSATGTTLALSAWDQTIQEKFEWKYFIPSDPVNDPNFDVDPGMIGKRGIYKDVVGSQSKYPDYQLRPNLLIAMTVAPELFEPDNARKALTIVESVLVSTKRLGVKTLDPSDWAYRGVYDNANHSSDETLAGGINYHQGPEWLWPLGYYLRARMRFFFRKAKCSKPEFKSQVARFVAAYTRQHEFFIDRSFELGLPELTNENSQHCPFSCEVQAWSSSTLLDAYYDVQNIEEMGIKQAMSS